MCDHTSTSVSKGVNEEISQYLDEGTHFFLVEITYKRIYKHSEVHLDKWDTLNFSAKI